MPGILNSAILARETSTQYNNALIIGKRISWKYQEKFGSQFTNNDDPIGQNITVKLPLLSVPQRNDMSFVSANSVPSAANPQPTTTISIDRTLTTPMVFNESDIALRLAQFSQDHIEPAANIHANFCELDISNAVSNCASGSVTSNFGSSSGLATVTANINYAGYVVGDNATALSATTVMKAVNVLKARSVPADSRIYGILSNNANASLTTQQQTLFQPLLNIDDSYRNGLIGRYAGVEFSTSQNTVVHVNGAQTTLAVTAGSVNAGFPETAALTVTATTQAIKAGDAFQSASVFLVNPQTKQPTQLPAQFTVLQDYASGVTSVVVGPAPVFGGPQQNITATINGTTLNLVGAANSVNDESYIFHKEAIQGVSPKLYLPKGLELSYEFGAGKDGMGFRGRYVRAYDAFGVIGGVGTGASQLGSRFDTCYAIKTLRHEWIVRLRCAAI